jgi:hypothetical protein
LDDQLISAQGNLSIRLLTFEEVPLDMLPRILISSTHGEKDEVGGLEAQGFIGGILYSSLMKWHLEFYANSTYMDFVLV